MNSIRGGHLALHLGRDLPTWHPGSALGLPGQQKQWRLGGLEMGPGISPQNESLSYGVLGLVMVLVMWPIAHFYNRIIKF